VRAASRICACAARWAATLGSLVCEKGGRGVGGVKSDLVV
jgi:hypothetical protein